ncbi:hypothetical protein GE300_20035 [Rhodobacteraceae bacterium 2CG4]|uniref:Voltage-gated potassium channel n=1 Tax=Halovulum marinum TaxID=2662447 RepID=A0A6L5Z5K7_9RHOB|nr:potassium channel family protein [Halovulum marinum]MSU91868.1 hypothetical protein [Halovulum marinum]
MMQLPRILKTAVELAARMSWRTALLAAAAHFTTSWAGLSLAGEAIAGSAADMIYYYATTGTTVGYGDLSPASPAGRLFAAFWIMPGAIASFAWFLGQGISLTTTAARKAATGMASYEARSGHNVFIGYIPGQTETLIAETEPGHGRGVIITTQNLEARVPANLDWVRAEAHSDVDALRRAGIAGAARAILMIGDDDATTSACLSLAGSWPDTEVVALFNDRGKAELIDRTCANVRTVVAPASRLLARAACSQHAERVVDRLLSRQVDDALRTAPYGAEGLDVTTFGELQALIIANAGVTPIGVTYGESGERTGRPRTSPSGAARGSRRRRR